MAENFYSRFYKVTERIEEAFLELRQYKDNSIQSKIIPILKLPRFLPRCVSDEKERQFQDWIF